MGKKSRKGKKAWRKNISSSDLDALIERTGREERSGGALDKAANEELFFVDKSGDETVSRKVDKHRNKVLHCDSVLQRSSLVPPLPSSNKRKVKDRDTAKPPQKLNPEKIQEKAVAPSKSTVYDPWSEDANTGSKRKKTKTKDTLPIAAAVEVDAPGCSYNPAFDDHQDALGQAVAQEMQKVYRKELEPEPVPRIVEGTPIDEEEFFFLEADGGDEEEENDEEEDNGTASAGSRPVRVKKLTKAELNKRARRRHVLKEEAERQKRARLKEEINKLSEIKESIAEEDEENEKLRIRRMASRKERLETCPPKLGKYRFKPEPLQVLLSEEVTGSLRKLKGCCWLLRDRFKSIQRRGLLEPRVRVNKKKSRKISYEPGSKGLRERQAHAAKQAEQEASKHALAIVKL